MLECSGALAHVPDVDKLSELSFFLVGLLKELSGGQRQKECRK